MVEAFSQEPEEHLAERPTRRPLSTTPGGAALPLGAVPAADGTLRRTCA
jgi:hypothetical protein